MPQLSESEATIHGHQHSPDDNHGRSRDDHSLLPPEPLRRKIHQKWQQAGYFTKHPNHNPSVISEKQLKKLFHDHDKPGSVLREYSLFLNPPRKRTLLLQYPNREVHDEYRDLYGRKPLELRIKPKCGIVEIEIPLTIQYNFDKEKGVQYGEAVRDSRLLQQGGSYGLGGGLGIGPKPTQKKDRSADHPERPSQEQLMENFDDANNKGHVMNKITLSGRIVPFKDGDPIYLAATFQEDICTWTKLDAMVQLRPNFSHIDAFRERQRSGIRHDGNLEDGAHEKPEKEAKAVNMAVKSAETNEDLDMYGGMAATNRLLKAMRDEPWQRLKWVDQDHEDSVEIYDENLVYQNPGNSPQLISEMSNEQYLDAISCPQIDLTKQGEKIITESVASVVTSHGNSSDPHEVSDDAEDDHELHDTVGDDEEEVEEEWETLPAGAVCPPSRSAEVRVESICRMLCIFPEAEEITREDLFRERLKDHLKREQYGFLWPDDIYHSYYKWRLAENRAGRGFEPDRDLSNIHEGFPRPV